MERTTNKAFLPEVKMNIHQQQTFPSGWNGSVRVDALRQSRQRHPGGRLLRARRHYHPSHCISPSDRCFAISSRSVGLYISKMYFSLWKTPGVSERLWSVNLEASISREYQTLGGYSGRRSE